MSSFEMTVGPQVSTNALMPRCPDERQIILHGKFHSSVPFAPRAIFGRKQLY